jgi:hypothetical protein
MCSRASTASDRPDRSRRSVTATRNRFARRPAESRGDHITHHVSVQIDLQLQLTAVVHRLALERQHHIAGAQPRTIRRAAWDHIGQHDAALTSANARGCQPPFTRFA